MPAYIVAEVEIHDEENYEKYTALHSLSCNRAEAGFLLVAKRLRCLKATGIRSGL